MTTSRTRRLIYAGVTTVGLLAGAAGIAAAATGQTATTAPGSASPATEVSDGPDASPSYTASVTTPDTETDTNLQALATISVDQARHAAEAATGGTAGPAALENENGNVVYGVQVTKADGTSVDVKVDAGNASVLSQQPGDGEEHGDSPSTGQGQEQASETSD